MSIRFSSERGKTKAVRKRSGTPPQLHPFHYKLALEQPLCPQSWARDRQIQCPVILVDWVIFGQNRHGFLICVMIAISIQTMLSYAGNLHINSTNYTPMISGHITGHYLCNCYVDEAMVWDYDAPCYRLIQILSRMIDSQFKEPF